MAILMTEPRCVVDTNVLISAALSRHGKPRTVVEFVTASGILLFSQATFEEFVTRMRQQRLEKYFADLRERDQYIASIFVRSSPFIEITKDIAACADPDDDMFLECALSGAADYIVTGNLKDFPASPFHGVAILSPADFAEQVVTQ